MEDKAAFQSGLIDKVTSVRKMPTATSGMSFNWTQEVGTKGICHNATLSPVWTTFNGSTEIHINWTTEIDDEEFFHSDILSPVRHLLILLIFLIIITASYLNTVTLMMFIKNGLARSPLNYLLINLSVVDFLNSTTSLPMFLMAMLVGEWPLQGGGCRWYGFSFILYGSAALNTTTAIAMERCDVLHPNQTYKGPTKARMLRSVAVAWSVAFLWALAPLCGWSSFRLDNKTLTCALYWHSRTDIHSSYSNVFCATAILTPLCIKAVCYCLVCKRVERVERTIRYSRSLAINNTAKRVSRVSTITTGSYKSSSFSKSAPADSKLTLRSNMSFAEQTDQLKIKKPANSRHKHMTFMMVLLVVISTLSWLPFVILTSVASFTETLPSEWLMIATLIATSSSVYHPLVYVALKRKYRRLFVKALRCRFQTRRIADEQQAPNGPQVTGAKHLANTRDYLTPDGPALQTYRQGTFLWGHSGQFCDSDIALAGSRCKDHSSISYGQPSPNPSLITPHSSLPSSRPVHSSETSTRSSTKLRQFSRDSPEFADIPEVSSSNHESVTNLGKNVSVCQLGQFDENAEVRAVPEAVT